MKKIVNIKKIAPFDVYDITVENHDCFQLYNTIFAHNSRPKVSGGTGLEYSANNVFIIGRAQDKDQTSKEILGYEFTINIEKSRFIKEKSKLSFSVSHNSGIDYYSGILELALESGDVIKPNNGWYQLVDTETGEMIGQKVRESATAKDDFLGVVLQRKSFIDFVAKKYKLGNLSVEEV